MSQSKRIVSCTFCGQRGSRSREDAFPHWLVQAIGGKLPVEALSQFTHERGDSEPMMRKKFGDAAIYKLPNVCHRCNTVWMSQLETAAKPLLMPLLNGDDVTLDRASQETIGLWAYKTAVTFDACQEFAADGRRVDAEHGTRLVHDLRAVPPACSVWFGRFAPHTLPTAFALPHFRVQLFAPNQDGTPSAFGAERFTFVFAHLIVQVVAAYEPSDRNPFVNYSLADEVPMVRCWPTHDAMRLPMVAVPHDLLERVYFATARVDPLP